MQTSFWLVLSAALIGDFIVFFSSTLLLVHKKVVKWLAIYATPFAAGALLAAAFLDFLHDGVENYDPLAGCSGRGYLFLPTRRLAALVPSSQ
jgi:hypothetical protein